MFLEAVICSLCCYSVSGYFPPSLWLSPSINNENGEFTFDKTLVEGETSNGSRLFTSVLINNDPVGYSIVYQKYPGMFFVTFDSSYGRIYVNDTTSLDYETDQRIVILVAGGNPAGSGTATLTILVEDTNDNPPVFESSLYRARITSLDGVTAGSYVSTVKATDADSGVNQDLMYAITFGDGTSTVATSRFSVDSKTGNITTTGYAFEKAIYVLHIEAADNGTVPLTGTTTLYVCINTIYCGGATGLFKVQTLACVLTFWLFETIYSICL